jgi:hypothetical protein
LYRFYAPFSLAETVDETLMSFFVDLVVKSRIGVKARSDGENDGEEES